MKTISITLFSLVAMAGVAMAQAKPADPKAGPAAGATKPAAPAAPGAGKSPAPAPTAAPAPKIEVPKPPAEIAAMLKQMGSYANCTGIGMGGPDMKSEMKFKSTTNRKLALDGWWIQQTMNGTMGEGKASFKFKMEAYITWDAKAAKWRTMGMLNDGSSMAGTADFKDGKWEAAADTFGGMMGGKFREHGDMTDPKAGMKMWGEASTDSGRTWAKVFEITCKK